MEADDTAVPDAAEHLRHAAQYGTLATVKALLTSGCDVDAADEDGNTALYFACMATNEEVVRCLLDAGAAIDAADKKGRTSIHAAAEGGDVRIMDLLVQHGGDLHTATKNGWTALHSASENGDVRIMALLVEHGADVHTVTKGGHTTLSLSAMSAKLEAVQYLIDQNVAVDITTDNDSTALHYAARRGHVDTLAVLVKHGADIHAVDKKGRTPLHESASEKHAEAVQFLLEHGSVVDAADENGWTPLHCAAQRGHVATLAVLVQHGADIHAVDEEGRTPLHRSAYEGHAEAVQFLIEHGSVVDAAGEDGWTPLHHAARFRHVATLGVLVQHGADIHAVNKDGATPLHRSAYEGHAEAVQFLLEHGSVVDAADENGWTPLHFAARDGHVATLALLVKHSADIHAVNKKGRTPLHGSASEKHAEAVQFLIEHGSVVETAGEDGWTPLHCAARGGHVATLGVLVKHGADIHAVNKVGATPLYASAYEGHAEAVQFLLEHGSVVDAADNDGWTPLHCAARGGHVATLAVLVQHGADIHAVNKSGNSALILSIQNTKAEATKYLLECGASQCADQKGLSPLHHAAEFGDVQTLRCLVEHDGDVHCPTKSGHNIVHLAVRYGNVSALEYALDLNVDINAIADNDGDWETPLMLAIWHPDLKKACEMAFILCAREAEWNDEHYRHNLKRPDKQIDVGADKRETREQWRAGLCVCVHHWSREHLRIKVPSEVVARGAASVETYLADIARSGADGLTMRCKSCVVGPSEWGKTSLVLSLVARKSSLTQLKDRTIGIDLVSCIFGDDDRSSVDGSAAARQEITFWDFAGQTVYHVAHSLFFSRRTLYVVAVNLEAYAKQLQHRTKSETEMETAMNRFVTANMWRWLNMVISHQPEARFVFIGTKADRVDNDTTIQDVRDDLQDRLEDWERSAGQLNKEPESFKWLVVNATDSESIAAARQTLQHTIKTLDIGFPMGETYSHVLRLVKERREDVRSIESGLKRIERSIVRFKSFRNELVKKIDGLKRGECKQILRTLNDLGDILWYEHDDAGVLKDFIILDPMLVIDLVREVIRHDFATKNHVEWPHDGRITHELLSTFELWKDMDKDMMHAFKKLLQYFQLAYPAEEEVMQPESNLIVPTYWRVDRSPSSRSLLAQKSVCDDFAKHRWCWEYELPNELAEIIFDQFAVQSHAAKLKRVIRGACIEAKCEEYATSIRLMQQNVSLDVIRIEVSGTTIDVSWDTMRFYLMKMENVLEGYKKIRVGRYIVDRPSATAKEEARHPLGPVARAAEDALAWTKSESSVRAQPSWMPPDMLWYVNKLWKDKLQFQQLQMRSTIEAKLEVLRKLAIAGPARRLPALWMLQYFPEEKKVVLCVMSDLTGRCYHTPIEIETGSAVLAKHGWYIKTGLSILSTVASEALSLPLVQTAIGAVKSGLSKNIDHAQQLHNLIEELDIGTPSSDSEFNTRTTKLSPGVAADKLNDLLTRANDSADALNISELTNLKCAVTSTGEYVWAHEHEIKVLGNKVTPCESPPSVWADLPEPSPAPSPTAQSPTASPSASRTNTPRSTFKLSLCVDSVAGLTHWDWYKTYCTWKLFYEKRSSTPIASGATVQNADSAASPSWRSVKTTINAVASYEMLHECHLVVEVKRRSHFGWTKSIGQGRMALCDVLTATAKDTLQFEAFQVPLDDLTLSKRFVTIQLAGEK